jgi:DNA polymerase family B
MITEKYHESNILIAQKKGLPQFMQQKLIASNKEVELAKKSILHIKMQIQEASKNKPPVWIPYGEILAEMLPDKKGTDVRATQRMLSLAGMIPLTKIQIRVGSQMHDEHLIVASLEDLEEALEITQNQSGMPLFKLKVFKEIFLECFDKKKKIGKVDEDEEEGKKESRIAVTIDNLTSHYRLKYGKPIASKHMREYFIPEWLANNLVDEIDSNIDKRKKIYYPLVDEKNTPDQAIMASNQVYFLSNFAIKMPNDHPGLPKSWLKYEIMTLFRICEKDTQISFADYNENMIVENDFIQAYEHQGRKRLNQFVSSNQGSNGGAKNENTPDQAYLGVSAYFPKITVKQRVKYPHICALWDLAAKYPDAEVICEQSGDQMLVVQPAPPSQEVPEKAHDKPIQSQLQVTTETTFHQFPKTLTDVVPELKATGYIDSEWWREDRKENVDLKRAGQIYAFSLADATGRTISLHVNNFPDRKSFMSTILDNIEKFTTLIGFSIFGDYKFKTDLDHIKNNCTEVGVPERHSDIMTRMKFIDLQRVFGHRNVRTFLEKGSKVKYDGADLKVSLDDVALNYIGEGKPEGIDGKTVEHKSPEEQLRYCLNDAILCHKLLSKNDFELIQVIQLISQDIKLEFFETINGGYTSTWAGPKLKSLGCPIAPPELQKFMDDNTIVEGSKKSFVYVGGNVLDPKAGIYPDAVELDVNSMYPTMCIEHNISPDTVNCSHAECERDGRVPMEVMEIINNHLIEHGQNPRPWHWICKKKTGILTTAMKDYFNKKVEYKKRGDKLNEKEVKIMANSLYGSFGSPHFKFRDLRVAELITGFGNWTHRQLVTFAGDNVLYGDTDSLYLSKENEKIIEYAKNKLGVKLEEKRWKLLFLTNNAKTHIGIDEEGKVVYVGITGMKSNYPVYFKEVSKKLISKEFLEPFVSNQDTALKKVLEYIRTAFKGLAELNPSELSCKQLWVNNLWEYKNKNAIQKQVYKEILEDCSFDENSAKQKAQGDQIWKFWKVKVKGRSVTIHPERYQIDMRKYKEELFKAILPQLESFGLDIVDLKREIGVK